MPRYSDRACGRHAGGTAKAPQQLSMRNSGRALQACSRLLTGRLAPSLSLLTPADVSVSARAPASQPLIPCPRVQPSAPPAPSSPHPFVAQHGGGAVPGAIVGVEPVLQPHFDRVCREAQGDVGAARDGPCHIVGSRVQPALPSRHSGSGPRRRLPPVAGCPPLELPAAPLLHPDVLQRLNQWSMPGSRHRNQAAVKLGWWSMRREAFRPSARCRSQTAGSNDGRAMRACRMERRHVLKSTWRRSFCGWPVGLLGILIAWTSSASETAAPERHSSSHGERSQRGSARSGARAGSQSEEGA